MQAHVRRIVFNFTLAIAFLACVSAGAVWYKGYQIRKTPVKSESLFQTSYDKYQDNYAGLIDGKPKHVPKKKRK